MICWRILLLTKSSTRSMNSSVSESKSWVNHNDYFSFNCLRSYCMLYLVSTTFLSIVVAPCKRCACQIGVLPGRSLEKDLVSTCMHSDVLCRPNRWCPRPHLPFRRCHRVPNHGIAIPHRHGLFRHPGRLANRFESVPSVSSHPSLSPSASILTSMTIVPSLSPSFSLQPSVVVVYATEQHHTIQHIYNNRKKSSELKHSYRDFSILTPCLSCVYSANFTTR